MVSWAHLLVVASIFALAAICGGCWAYRPAKNDEPSFSRHLLTREKSNVRVSVAVLTAAESRAYFGLPLESEGVQPVWLRVENRNDYGLYLVPLNTDPNYFSWYEVAFMNHRAFSAQSNLAMDEFLQESRMRLRISPHETREGFLFTNLSEGTKYVNVEMVHEKGAIRDGFFFQLPNGKFDYERASLGGGPEVSGKRDFSIAELRRVVEGLPCCATDKSGAKNGDPLNFVLVGLEDDVLGALTRQGWDPTHVLASGAAWRTFSAFLKGDTYRYSPVSTLYVFGRPQAIAMQKARRTIHQRNHLRLWRAGFTCEGKPVWIGQISRDIGIRFASDAPFFVTHKIDPDVDDARNYLAQDLLASEYLYGFAFAKGAPDASQEHPATNLTGDPYFSDGLRAVMLISSRPVSEDRIELLKWDRPADSTGLSLS